MRKQRVRCVDVSNDLEVVLRSELRAGWFIEFIIEIDKVIPNSNGEKVREYLIVLERNDVK